MTCDHGNHVSNLPPHAMQQHQNYARCLRALGCRAFRWTLHEGHYPVGHVQVFQRKIGPFSFAWVPRGPVWSEDIDIQVKAKCFRWMGQSLSKSTTWVIHPNNTEDIQSLSGIGSLQVSTTQNVVELDLCPDRETRLKAQHSKWRNRLRHAQRNQIKTRNRTLDLSIDAPLLAKELSQRRQRRYATLPIRFTHAWTDENPEQSRMFLAYQNTTCIAFILLLLHAPCATYHMGWTGAQGRKHSAHTLLLWQASNWLADKGYQRLDLGGVDPVKAPGLTRFKPGSGAKLHMIPKPFVFAPFVLGNM